MFPSQPKALLFDLMGTCVDWKTSVMNALNSSPASSALTSSTDKSDLAAAWRAAFFEEIHRRFDAGEDAEDIDSTHRRLLEVLLAERNIDWSNSEKNRLVRSWHDQIPWPDAELAIAQLKKDYFVLVLANGTTKLQLDIIKSSGLGFHTLLSSQLLGFTKPDPRIYLRALELLDLPPDEACMVAAHAYDLRAAAKVGIRTVYIHRSTEDLNEDMDLVRKEFDVFVDGIGRSPQGGLMALANLLQR